MLVICYLLLFVHTVDLYYIEGICYYYNYMVEFFQAAITTNHGHELAGKFSKKGLLYL